MTLAYPWLLGLPLLFLIIRLALRPARASAPFASSSFLGSLPKSLKARACEPTLFTLSLCAVCALSIAAARPQRITVIEAPQRARNIMLVIDASNSMSAEDFPTSFGYASRMEGVKRAVSEYVRSRKGDRIGIVVFGETGYLQCPLTTDSALVENLVQSLYPRMAGDGTAIGDGLGLALKRLRNVEGSSKAVILMTDGVNTAGRVSPLKAADVAKDLGIQVNTIGIGTRSAPIGGAGMGGLLPVPPNMMADFDEKTLREIASLTGGAYFNASSLEGFQEVYRKIEKLQETEAEQPDQRLVQELFPWFAVAGLITYLLGTLLKSTLFMRVP